jgi:hypothetical protein
MSRVLKWSINRVTNPNPVYSHLYTWHYCDMMHTVRTMESHSGSLKHVSGATHMCTKTSSPLIYIKAIRETQNWRRGVTGPPEPWDSKIGSWVPQDLEPSTTVLAKPAAIYLTNWSYKGVDKSEAVKCGSIRESPGYWRLLARNECVKNNKSVIYVVNGTVKLRLTVSPYSMYSNQMPRKIILTLLLSGGGAGVAHYCSIDESRSWPT